MTVRPTLIIPAAGRGTRLGGSIPKVLYPVNGRAMIDHLLARYVPQVERIVLVLQPDALDPVRRHCEAAGHALDYAIQPAPTGMLDAVLAPWQEVTARRPPSVWMTWCDQVAVGDGTVRRLAELSGERPPPALVMPTATRRGPYTHLQRDESGRITAILHRREGDPIPEVGESDIGLFALSGECYERWLPAFAAEPHRGATTGERNFLPFIAWVARRATVRTFPCEHEVEAVGVNDLADLRRVEAYLREVARGAGRA